MLTIRIRSRFNLIINSSRKENRLDQNTAVVGTVRKLNVSSIAPASSPLVSHEPIVLSIKRSISDNGHGVIYLTTFRYSITGRIGKNTGRFEILKSTRDVDRDRNSSSLRNDLVYSFTNMYIIKCIRLILV